MSSNHNGTTPPSPFTAAGRAHGKSNEDLRKQGLDGLGHPLPSQPTNGPVNGRSAPHRPSGQRNQSIAQLAQSIGSMELSNQDDLYAFCEAYRAILNYLAVSAHLANGQLKASARAQAKQAHTGWMTPAQALKLANTLRQVGKDLERLASACVAGAADAVKAWRRFEGLLDDLEGEKGHKFSRPSGGRRGGFSLS